MADLRRSLAPGMGTNQILARLGAPQREEAIGAGSAAWRYAMPGFPADGEMSGTRVIGLIVTITNGHLAHWGCAYLGAGGDSTPVSPGRGDDQSPGPRAPLNFYIVSSTPLPNGRYVDSEFLPALGYVSPRPDLTVERIADLTMGQRTDPGSGSNYGVWSFGVHLTAGDAAVLQTLTQSNLTKKLLVSVGDEPVYAGTIKSPLDSGGLLIETAQRPVAELLRRKLPLLERK